MVRGLVADKGGVVSRGRAVYGEGIQRSAGVESPKLTNDGCQLSVSGDFDHWVRLVLMAGGVEERDGDGGGGY